MGKYIKLTGEIKAKNVNIHLQVALGNKLTLVKENLGLQLGKRKKQVSSVTLYRTVFHGHYAVTLQGEVCTLPQESICPTYFVDFFVGVENMDLC